MSTQSFLDRHYFLIRRLHSLSGVVPIGVFLFPHLTTNSSIIWGRFLNNEKYGDAGVETFQHEVNFIHDLPALVIIEWTVLFLPILFHSLVGIWIAMSARPNVARYAYQDNWRYTWQRITGYIGIVFLFMHITSLRFGWDYWGLMVPFDYQYASSSTGEHFQESPLGLLIPLFYAVGVGALIFHFANGLWTAAITWGLTVSTQAQRRWGWVCLAVGIGLSGAGAAAIVGFSQVDVEKARQIETQMLDAGVEPEGALGSIE